MDEWTHKGRVLDQWCEAEKRDPKTIARTVNLGFYMGADAKGAARGEETFQRHWGTQGAERSGWLRGTPVRRGRGDHRQQKQQRQRVSSHLCG